MFNIGAGEILIVLVVAFVIVGPDDLPRVARWLGRQVRRLRKALRDIKEETGWDELEKEVRDVQKDVRATVRELDVSADLKDAAKGVRDELKGVSRDMERDLQQIDAGVRREVDSVNEEARAAADAADKR